MGLRPWEYYRMTYVEYGEMVDGWQLKDQKLWEKFRLLAYFAIMPYMKRRTTNLNKIIELPLIDGKMTDRVKENIDYLLRLKEEARKKRESAPATV